MGKPKISHQKELNPLSAAYFNPPCKMLLKCQLYYLRMDNRMGPSLCFLLTHLLIQSLCHHAVMGGRPTCSTAHHAHITLKRKCLRSRCVSWGRRMLHGSSAAPTSFVYFALCLHFHSVSYITPCFMLAAQYEIPCLKLCSQVLSSSLKTSF